MLEKSKLITLLLFVSVSTLVLFGDLNPIKDSARAAIYPNTHEQFKRIINA